MKTRNLLVATAALGISALAFGGSAKADIDPVDDTVNAELTVNTLLELDVVKNYSVLTPTFSHIRDGATGSITEPEAFTVNVATNNANGCLIKVKAEAGDHESDKIKADDIALKYSGDVSGAFSNFTALDTAGKDFWTTDGAVIDQLGIDVDMKISNLRAYVAKDAQTVYDNTITFEVVANSSSPS